MTLLHCIQVYESKWINFRFSLTCTWFPPCRTPLSTKLLLYHHGRSPASAQCSAEAKNLCGARLEVKHTKELFPKCSGTVGQRRVQARRRSKSYDDLPSSQKKQIPSPVSHYLKAFRLRNSALLRCRGMRRHFTSGYAITQSQESRLTDLWLSTMPRTCKLNQTNSERE